MATRRLPNRNLYRALAEFRYEIRRFSSYSAAAAKAAGLPPQQHQALLVIKGALETETVTVGILASRLIIAPHTAVELVKRLEHSGFVNVSEDPLDRRKRILKLTESGEDILARLSAEHLREITLLAPRLVDALAVLTRAGDKPS